MRTIEIRLDLTLADAEWLLDYLEAASAQTDSEPDSRMHVDRVRQLVRRRPGCLDDLMRQLQSIPKEVADG